MTSRHTAMLFDIAAQIRVSAALALLETALNFCQSFISDLVLSLTMLKLHGPVSNKANAHTFLNIFAKMNKIEIIPASKSRLHREYAL